MVTNGEMDQLFQALAHETRREILDRLRERSGQTIGQIAANFDVSRIAVMNHIAVLERADLVISQKEGRTRRLYLNVVPIQMIHDRWSDQYSEYWASKLTFIKRSAERASE